MPGVRICIVGGGSPYMTSMFATLARFAREGGLAESEIVLMDRNPEAVKLTGEWGRQGARNGKLPLSFEYTTDLDHALAGADFVLSTFRTGGLETRYLDETIPLRHQELGNETVGVGGLFMALRTVPEIVRIINAVRKQCPDAWLINYTNPCHMITMAAIQAGHAKTIGLCDGVAGVRWLMSKLLRLPLRRNHEIEVRVAGVNHFTWALDLVHQGRALYSELDNLIANAPLSTTPGEVVTECSEFLNDTELDACRLYRYYGLLPSSVYYARYYYNLKKMLRQLLAPDYQHRSRWLQELSKKKFAEIRRQLDAGEAKLEAVDEEDAAHGDQAISTIHAIANDTREVDVVNVVNQGAVPCLPEDAVVEVSGMLGRNGATPLAAGNPPLGLQGILRSAENFGRLAVEAALKGDRRLVLQAALAHPAHRDLDDIENVIAELFRAQAEYLPQFA